MSAEPDPRFNTYLCSYCNNMFTAAAGSIDRTRFVRCPVCAFGDSPWAFVMRPGRERERPVHEVMAIALADGQLRTEYVRPGMSVTSTTVAS
jgi:hypothetical protein